MVKIKRALISVYDKTGLTDLVKALKEIGVDIISTGGTAEFIKSLGADVKNISDITGFPEILNGRVKTLHPKVHGALLSLRESHAHMAEIRSHGIEVIDLVVANLYPFKKVADNQESNLQEALENIDIGGVSLLRSAAKNYNSVAVLSSPAQYENFISEIKTNRALVSDKTLSALAVEAFNITAVYDNDIKNYLNYKLFPQNAQLDKASEPLPVVSEPKVNDNSAAQQQTQEYPNISSEQMPDKIENKDSFTLPDVFTVNMQKASDLRYGENPHQAAAFYKKEKSDEVSISCARQLHGKPLSYNNIMDMDTALEIVKEFESPAAAIVKHANPCGAAAADNINKAYMDALECDKLSAYGGIVGLNRTVDLNTANSILLSGFIECVIAPGYDKGAFEKLISKKNMRIMETPAFSEKRDSEDYFIRQVTGGALLQQRDLKSLDRAQLRIVTKKKPTAEEVDSLLFAWKIVKYVKSNAIVLAKDTKTIGIGAGQMSRVDAVFMATQKASRTSRGSVMASDAFFPKIDGAETAARAGVTAIIQPGGSKADDEIIRTADRRGMAMVFTGIRHFRH